MALEFISPQPLKELAKVLGVPEHWPLRSAVLRFPVRGLVTVELDRLLTKEEVAMVHELMTKVGFKVEVTSPSIPVRPIFTTCKAPTDSVDSRGNEQVR